MVISVDAEEFELDAKHTEIKILDVRKPGEFADMHLKNFSLITDDIENIHLSPCYDLLSTRLLIAEKDDPEELALTLNGKKKNIFKKTGYMCHK